MIKYHVQVVVLSVSAIFSSISAWSQGSPASWADIRMAAESGDVAAQIKLANQYILHGDLVKGEAWMRKAAKTGSDTAQFQLGNLLLRRARAFGNRDPDEKAMLGSEAIALIEMSAKQGNSGAEVALASACLGGDFTKVDAEAAYEWADLASHAPASDPAHSSGITIRDSAVLQMTTDQIKEARLWVAHFKPVKAAKGSQPAMPLPAWARHLQLSGLSGSPSQPLAIINNQTFGVGDSLPIQLKDRTVQVQCLKINAQSVLLQVQGLDNPVELTLTPP